MATCPNCEATLTEPAPRFCPECGQETRVRAPTVGEFAQQFGGAYLSTEGALWRTLRLLLTKPGELTVQYLRGRRKHYVLPLRLYLTISVMVLLAMRLLAVNALQVHPKLEGDAAKPQPEFVVIDLDNGMRAGVKDGAFFCERLPGWLCRRLASRIATDRAGLEAAFARAGERTMANIGAVMFLLLPAFALALKLAYWNRGLRYTEHLVFALHVHAFWFAAFALTLTDLSWMDFVAAAAIPVYTWIALGRVYRDRRWTRLLRCALIAPAYLATLVFGLLALLAWSVLA